MDINLLRAHRENMEQLRRVEPAERFAYAMYQAYCIGMGSASQPWDFLTAEARAGWIAAADFCDMYKHILEIDAIVRAL